MYRRNTTSFSQWCFFQIFLLPLNPFSTVDTRLLHKSKSRILLTKHSFLFKLGNKEHNILWSIICSSPSSVSPPRLSVLSNTVYYKSALFMYEIAFLHFKLYYLWSVWETDAEKPYLNVLRLHCSRFEKVSGKKWRQVKFQGFYPCWTKKANLFFPDNFYT